MAESCTTMNAAGWFKSCEVQTHKAGIPCNVFPLQKIVCDKSRMIFNVPERKSDRNLSTFKHDSVGS